MEQKTQLGGDGVWSNSILRFLRVLGFGMLVGLIVAGIGVAAPVGEQPSSPVSAFSEGRIESRYQVRPNDGEIGQEMDSCWTNFGAVARAANVTITSTTALESAEMLPTVKYVNGDMNKNAKQYLIRYLDEETNNCRALNTPSISPNQPTNLSIGSDADGIFLNGTGLSTMASTTYTVTAIDLDSGRAEFSFDLVVESDTQPSLETGWVPDLFNWYVGIPVSIDVSAVWEDAGWGYHPLRGGNEPVSWGWKTDGVARAVPGVEIDETNGDFSGTPTTEQTRAPAWYLLSDLDGDIHESSFDVIVHPARVPPNVKVMNGSPVSIENKTIEVNPTDQSYIDHTVTLSNHFEDADSLIANAVSYDPTSTDMSVATVSERDGILTVRPLSKGTTTVRVETEDADFPAHVASSAFLEFVVTVPDRAPRIANPLDDALIDIGDSFTFDNLSNIYSDIDGDTHQSVCSSNNMNFSCGVDNIANTMTVRALAAAQADETAVITVNPVGYTADDPVVVSDTVTVTAVVPAAKPPRIRTNMNMIPPQTLVVAGLDWDETTIDLDTFFFDQDSAIVFSATSDDTGVVIVLPFVDDPATREVDESSILTLQGVSKGSTSITVKATDADVPTLPAAQLSFDVTVPDRPPTLATPGRDRVNVILTVNATVREPYDLTLSDYIVDPDGDPIVWYTHIHDTNRARLVIDPDNDLITVTPCSPQRAFWLCTSDSTVVELGVRNSDPDVSVWIIVHSNLRPLSHSDNPTLLDISDQTLGVSGATWDPISFDLDQYFSDFDAATYYINSVADPSIVYSASSDPEGFVTTSIDEDNVLTITGVNAGTTQVSARGIDGQDARVGGATIRFMVTVPDRPPVAISQPEPIWMNAGEDMTVDLSTYFSDPDGGPLRFGANTGDDSVVTASISGSMMTLMVPPTAADGASATVTVVPVGSQDSSLKWVVVERADTNQPPVVKSDPGDIDDQTITKTDGSFDPITLDLSDYFIDPNGPMIEYSATPTDSGVVTTSVTGSNLTLTGVAAGSTDVTVTATDTDDNTLMTAELDFMVDVIDNPPVVISQPDDTELRIGESFELDVSQFIADPDGDTITYSVRTSPYVHASALVAGTNLQLTLMSGAAAGDVIPVTVETTVGSTTVMVMFSITLTTPEVGPSVKADPGSIPAQTLAVGSTGLSYDDIELDLSTYFEDPDSSSIDYSATSSDIEIVTVSVTGPVLTLSGMAKGSATVTVNAADSEDDTLEGVELTFGVTVPDRPPIKRFDPSTLVVEQGSSGRLSGLSGLYFFDPDGDSMTFAFLSDNTMVTAEIATGKPNYLEVSVDSSVPISTSAATITINPVGFDQVTSTLEVEVVAASPMKPEVRGTPGAIADQTIEEIDSVWQPVMLNLDNYFYDRNNHDIGYTTSLSESGVVNSLVSDSILTLTGVAKGSTMVTVTATDVDDTSLDTSMLSFRVNVDDRPPVKVSNPTDLSIQTGMTESVMNLAQYFRDADNDPLTFEASSSNTDIIATVSGQNLDITLGQGASVGDSAEITINPIGYTEVTATFSVRVVFTITGPGSGGNGNGGNGQTPTTQPSAGGNGQTPSTQPSAGGNGQSPSTQPSAGGNGQSPSTQPSAGGNGQSPATQPPAGGGPTGGGGVPPAQPPAVQPPSTGTGFSDSVGTTHEANINRLAEDGITRGCNPPTNSLFCPDRAVTRGEMATFMVRSFDLAESGSNLFADDNGNTHEGNINAFAAAGITRGCNPPENTRYCPDRPVTRAQMATFLARAMDLAEGTGDFEDTVGSPHADDINRIASVGITRGCNPPTNSRYCPDRAVTRGEMATFLIRADDLDAS